MNESTHNMDVKDKGRFKPSQHVGQHVQHVGQHVAFVYPPWYNTCLRFYILILGHIFIYIWYFVETKQMRVVYLI